MKTRIFQPAEGWGYLSLVTSVSSGQIPLFHVRPPVITADTCVRIDQVVGSRELTLLGTYQADQAGCVGRGGIDSALPYATAVFVDGQPCFYRHRLQYPVRLTEPVLCWHPDAPVTVYGTAYRLTAVPAGEGRWYIDVYLPTPVSGAYAVYTADNGTLVFEHRETLYPLPLSYVTTTEAVAAASATEPMIAIERVTPTKSRLFVPVRCVPDVRPTITVKWRLERWHGFALMNAGDWQEAVLRPMEQATAADSSPSGWMTVLPDPAATLDTPLGDGEYLKVSVQADGQVEVDCHPQGLAPLRLRWRSGLPPLDLPDRFTLKDGFFVPELAVAAGDSGLPTVSVGSVTLNEPWHIRVGLGRLVREVNGVRYLYALPDYLHDRFSPMPPYAQQYEAPTRIDEHTFRVSRVPIAREAPVSLTIQGQSGAIALTITEIDQDYGVIRTRESVPEGAAVTAAYCHRKDYVTYRGTEGRYLDLNPRHLSHVPTRLAVTLESSRRLIGQPIYLYWLPYAVLTDSGETLLRTETLTHAFAPLDDPTALLLATITVNLPYGPASLTVRDARRRGGGLPEHYSIPAAYERVAAAYSDIGSWGGRPVPLAGSYVVELAPWSPAADPGAVRRAAEVVGTHGQLPLVRVPHWPEQTLLGAAGLYVDLITEGAEE